MVIACDAAHYAEALRLMDEEFIHSRGRTVSLAKRYPGVYSEDNRDNLFVEHVDGRIVAAVAIKPFSWNHRDGVCSGAMVGGVCTAPEHRGHGHATAILRHIDQVLAERRIDCALLWTGQPGFYARLGWETVPGEVFGELMTVKPLTGDGRVTRSGPASDHAGEVEEMRRSERGGMTRTTASYQRLPLPAAQTFCALAGGETNRALALAGELENQAFVYEMHGDASGLHAILADLRRNYERVWLNDFAGSATQAQCARVAEVAWQEKPARLCRIHGSRLPPVDVREWRIPAWDRI